MTDINAQLLDIATVLSRVDATTGTLVKGMEHTAREIDTIQDALAGRLRSNLYAE